ncbi:MAG: hypothetical protein U0469_01410 [Candidatus Paceibacterota bacterium]|jgi:hypothetical protein
MYNILNKKIEISKSRWVALNAVNFFLRLNLKKEIYFQETTIKKDNAGFEIRSLCLPNDFAFCLKNIKANVKLIKDKGKHEQDIYRVETISIYIEETKQKFFFDRSELKSNKEMESFIMLLESGQR